MQVDSNKTLADIVEARLEFLGASWEDVEAVCIYPEKYGSLKDEKFLEQTSSKLPFEKGRDILKNIPVTYGLCGGEFHMENHLELYIYTKDKILFIREYDSDYILDFAPRNH